MDPTTSLANSATNADSTDTSDTLQSAEVKSQDPIVNEPVHKNPFWKPREPPMLGPDGKPLSRNATKKLLKQQQYLERRPLMRQQEKLKRKQKEKERREAIELAPPPKRQKLDMIQSNITIGIDMSFDHLMLEKEVKSMVDQIKRCYSFNRTCKKIVHIALTSFTGASKDEFVKRANGYELWKNFTIHDEGLETIWPSEEIPGTERIKGLKELQKKISAKSEAVKAKVLEAAATTAASNPGLESTEQEQSCPRGAEKENTSSQSSLPAELSPSVTSQDKDAQLSASSDTTLKPDYSALELERQMKEEKLATVPAVKKVVYLSADSPNTITHLDPGTCYVLGGIVDKNRFPRLCQEKAEKMGLETAQLPIGDYIQMSSRRILTVNQECGDWKEAFLKVIPQRKLEEKQRIRRGTEAWKAKYGDQGKGRPSATMATTSGSSSVANSVADDSESLCSDLKGDTDGNDIGEEDDGNDDESGDSDGDNDDDIIPEDGKGNEQ
ncbi:tRNA (guanine(9)-N(1))-methyltransferase [Podila epigama]|nr:tRNA (guanine(9)-N(1))-methyltransferase [Podila epigama]